MPVARAKAVLSPADALKHDMLYQLIPKNKRNAIAQQTQKTPRNTRDVSRELVERLHGVGFSGLDDRARINDTN
jgi:hypothetical protein